MRTWHMKILYCAFSIHLPFIPHNVGVILGGGGTPKDSLKQDALAPIVNFMYML
jgi:hypothetical protein